nr:TIM barrel protein [uncultured Cohaesibacter sp.]
MPRFSANLGFLWSDLPIAQAIMKAKEAGFDAVECHWPYQQDASQIRLALGKTGLPMLGINTSKGNRPGDFGLAAQSERTEEARAAIQQAFSYARAIKARAIHVMAGCTEQQPLAQSQYLENLSYACDLADREEMTVLIEPINGLDSEGYFLQRVAQAADIIDKLDHPRLKIMLDCYHAHRMQDDPVDLMKAYLPFIGHVQIASFPNRQEPDENEDFRDMLMQMTTLGYEGYFGAEYHPRSTEEAGLGWLKACAE